MDLQQFTPKTILYVEDLARVFRVSPKVVRNMASAGEIPAPFKRGRRLAWLWETVVDSMTERSRAAGEAESVRVVITTVHHKGKSALQAIWRMPHPCHPEKELKATALVPPALDREQAKAWAQGEIGRILPKLLAKAGLQEKASVPEERIQEPSKIEPKKPGEKVLPTFREFAEERFIPEKVSRWKKSSQDTTVRLLRQHVIPLFGDERIDLIDEDLIAQKMAKMKGKPSTKNLRLEKLRAVLVYAKELRLLSSLPTFTRFKVPRTQIQVYEDHEVLLLVEAAERLGPIHHLIVLLLLDLGLRAGEACALKWEDINLSQGVVTIQRGVYQGEETTPKGIIGTLVLSSALKEALAEHRKTEPIGAHVLYRRSNHTAFAWTPFTKSSLRWHLNAIQEEAGLKTTGIHFMRHTSITSFARLGIEAVELQGHARHSKLTTTQGYIHMAGISRSQSVVSRLDASRSPDASRSKRRSKRSK